MALSPGISSRIVSKPSSMGCTPSSLTPSGVRLFRKRGRGSLVRNQAFVWSKGELERLHSLSFRPRHSLVPDVVDVIVTAGSLGSKSASCTLRQNRTLKKRPNCPPRFNPDGDSDVRESSDFETGGDPMCDDMREGCRACGCVMHESMTCDEARCRSVMNSERLRTRCHPLLSSTQQTHGNANNHLILERPDSSQQPEKVVSDQPHCLPSRPCPCVPERPPSPSPPRAVVSRLVTSMVDLSIETV